MEAGVHLRVVRVKLSFIVPTIGRPTLASVLADLKREMGPEDEALVVNEGSGTETARMVAEAYDPRIIYWSEKETERPKGNGIRDAIIRRARNDFLVFADDDDKIAEGAGAIIRKAVNEAPNRPHLFAMIDARGIVQRRSVEMCNIGTPQFVPPNDHERLGRWENMNWTGADWLFIDDTLSYYPEGPVVHDEIVSIVGQACIEHPQT